MSIRREQIIWKIFDLIIVQFDDRKIRVLSKSSRINWSTSEFRKFYFSPNRFVLSFLVEKSRCRKFYRFYYLKPKVYLYFCKVLPKSRYIFMGITQIQKFYMNFIEIFLPVDRWFIIGNFAKYTIICILAHPSRTWRPPEI